MKMKKVKQQMVKVEKAKKRKLKKEKLKKMNNCLQIWKVQESLLQTY